MPTHSGPRSASAACTRAPNDSRAGSGTGSATVGLRRVRHADHVAELADAALGQRALEVGEKPYRRGRISEDRGADLDAGGAGGEELQRVQPGPDAAHAEDR